MTANIYKITCSETDKVYFGSTIQNIDKRFQHHICAKNTRFRELKNPKMELLEVVDIKDRYEVERHYIIHYDCVNKQIPLRTKKEWAKDTNKNEKQRKAYHEKFRKKCLEKVVCECGSKFNRMGLSRHKKTQKHQDFISSN